MIRDSRCGELKEYPISAVSARIIKLMVDTKRIGDVNKEFTNGSSIDAAKEVALLREKGLLFEEENRFMSLPLIAADCRL